MLSSAEQQPRPDINEMGPAQIARLAERQEEIDKARLEAEGRALNLQDEATRKEIELANQKRDKSLDLNTASPVELSRFKESLGYLGEAIPGGKGFLNVVEKAKDEAKELSSDEKMGIEKMMAIGRDAKMALSSLVEELLSNNLLYIEKNGKIAPFKIGDMKISIKQNTNEDRVLLGDGIYNKKAITEKIKDVLARNEISIEFENSKKGEPTSMAIDGQANVEVEVQEALDLRKFSLSEMEGAKAQEFFEGVSEKTIKAKNEAKDFAESLIIDKLSKRGQRIERAA